MFLPYQPRLAKPAIVDMVEVVEESPPNGVDDINESQILIQDGWARISPWSRGGANGLDNWPMQVSHTNRSSNILEILEPANTPSSPIPDKSINFHLEKLHSVSESILHD